MAFELTRELTSGVVGNYWKISSALVACTDNPIVGINLELYLTRDARLEGKSPVLNENITLSIYDIDMSYSFDFRACLYAALRNISPWSSAVDVFDDPNKLPVIADASLSTTFNTAKTISLISWDPFNLPLTYSVVEQPANGLIVLNDKECTYTPDDGFYGVDLAKFKTNNGEFDSPIANINISVADTNQRPVSNDSLLTLDMDNDCLINFNANDPNNLPLTYVITEGPFNGTILVDNNVYTYRPNASFIGSDYIIYKSSNGSFESLNARINFDVVTGVIIE